FDPLRENPRAALLLTGGKVILSWASSCDVGPFHGWIIAYDAHSLAQVGVFNTTPDGDDGGVWQGDAGLAADAEGRVYAATGNGTFDAASGGHDYGDTILQLTLGPGGFTVSDYFTPFNQRALNAGDRDLGSGGPMIFDQPEPHGHFLFMGGKGGSAYLVDRDRMGRFNAAANTATLQTIRAPGMIMGASAFWNNHVYSLWSSDVIKDFVVRGSRLVEVARGADTFTDPGATPTISANGSKDGIVWVVQTKTWNGRDRPAVLRAYDAANVARELFHSDINSGRDGAGQALRFAIPTVVNGRVYVGGKREVDIYGLLPRA
ncbi:MAG: pyrrolo-quinoline quinone, partial [Chthoniobacterales bacterium]